jgi:hypothetical protein
MALPATDLFIRVSRFVGCLQKFELNYDLFSLSCDGVPALMPAEFDRFKIVNAA